MRTLVALFIMSAAVMGCAQGLHAFGSGQELALQRRATLDRIASECGLPATTFVVAAADDIRFRPSPDAHFESLSCALEKVRMSNIPLNSMSFVGNEAVRAESTVASRAPDHQPVVGWSVDAPARTADDSFARFIVSGPVDAVDEFTRDAQRDGWSVEARATASANHAFAQYRAPIRPGQTQSFMDRYLRERPRRLNIAGVVSQAEAQ